MQRFTRSGMALLSVGLLWLAGCESESYPPAASSPHRVAPTASAGVDIPRDNVPHNGETITVASFNIQVFGTTKSRKPHVMNILAEVVNLFDVIAIQEFRSKDDEIIARLVDMANAKGGQHNWIIGPRIGRTRVKEQYAYVFDANRIELVAGSAYTVEDPYDRLHREPLVATFRVLGLPPEQAFTFTLVNIHTDPDEVPTELAALADIFSAIQQQSDGDDDVILLGDFNASEYRMGRLGQLPGVETAIADQTTNTRRTAAYDNILYDRRFTTEYRSYAGVLDLAGNFNLTMEQALEVSDHLPVWAAFSVYEDPVAGTIASRPGGSIR